MASSDVLALIAGAMLFFFVLFVIAYVYSALVLMAIAKKTKTENGWLAWIPFANLYLMTQIAEVPWWTIFLFLLGFIPFVGFIAVVALMVWYWWKISEACSKPGWWGILMLVPIVNVVIMGVLAWGKK